MGRVAGTGAHGASPSVAPPSRQARLAQARAQRAARRAAAAPPPTSERTPASHPRPDDRAAKPKLPTLRDVQAYYAARSEARLRAIHDRVIAEQSVVPHGVMGLLSNVIGNLAEDAIYSPAGIYGIGKGAYHDIGSAAHGDPSFSRTRHNAAQIGRQTLTGIEHPLRRPGDTLLLGLAAATAGAGLAARTGAASRALAGDAFAPGGLRAALTRPGHEGGSLLHAPEPGSLTLKHGGLEVKTPAYRNPAARAVQKAYHRAHGNQVSASYAGKAIAAERRVTEPLQRAPAGELAARARRLTVPQETALRVVAEGTPIPDRIRFVEGRLAKAKTAAERRDHRQEILLLRAADRYVTEQAGKPVLRAEFRKPLLGGGILPRRGVGPVEMKGTYGLMGKVAGEREKALAQVDRLTSEQIASRKQAPGRIVAGATFEKPTPGKLGVVSRAETKALARVTSLQRRYEGKRAELGMSSPTVKRLGGALSVAKDHLQQVRAGAASRVKPTGIVGADTFAGGDIRIPYTPSIPTTSRGMAAQYKGGIPQAPGSTTHEFTGALLRSGNFRKRTAKLVAESAVEAQRYSSILKLRDKVIQAAHDTPQKGDVPIRLDAFKSAPLPEAMKQIEAKLQEGAGLSRQERKQIGSHYDELRLHIFPEKPTEGVKWVNEKLLNGLHQPGAPLAAAVGHVPVELIDAVNNASRAAILYLKPAYAVPNVAGNLFLNLVQQGAAAPANVARAVVATHQLGQDAVSRLDAIMGEGFVHAISGDQGLGHAAVAKAAGVWSKGVDLPFRRASFLYEARKAGYRTPARLRSLLLDEAHRDKLVEVAQRANAEIIDYGRLSTKEREIVRRILFFYPWLKGSTMYAGRFMAEHPIKAAGLGQLGQAGQKQAQKDLGNVPAFAQGLFKVGGTKDLPLTSNPASAAILGQPAQIAEAVTGLAKGNVPSALRLANFFTPAVGLAEAETYRKDPFTGQDVKGNAAQVALHQLTGGLPQVTLAKRLTGSQAGKLYPLTRKQSIEQFVGGTASPRTTDRAKLNELARAEKRAGMSAPAKVVDQYRHESAALLADGIKYGAYKPGTKALPANVAAGYRLRTVRYANYATAGIKKPTRGASDAEREKYQRATFTADVALLRKRGSFTAKQAQDALAWAGKVGPSEIQKERGWYGRTYFGGSDIEAEKSVIHEWRQAHGG